MAAVTDNKQAAGRLLYIDTLRGVAAFSVVLQHACEAVHASVPAGLPLSRFIQDLLGTINLGRFGVILFFLISGFVIPFSLKRDIWTFAVTRFFRLYPVYWLCIATALGVTALLELPGWSYREVLINMTMVQRLLHVRLICGQFWTLTYEIVFYVLCAVLFIVSKLRSASIVGAITIGLLLLADFPAVSLAASGRYLMLPRELPSFLPFLFLGTLLRLAIVEREPLAQRLARFAIPLAFLSIPIINGALTAASENPLLAPLPASSAAMLALVLFLLAARFRPSPPLLTRLGNVSYSAYLFQDIALTLLLHFAAPVGTASALLFVVAMLGSTAIIAAIIYRCVEVPSIEIGRAITGRRRSLVTDVAP